MNTALPAADLPPIPLPARRLGVLVPPANPTVEIEYPALLPGDTALHAMRLPVFAGDLQARNRSYVASYASCLKGFGHLRLDALSIAMTGSHYRLGHSGDLDLCRRLTDAAGLPVETASLAIARALQTLGIEHLTLISPYPDAVTAEAREYWASAGFALYDLSSFGDQLVAYILTPAQVLEAILRTRIHPRGAVLLSGTGMRTLEAIALARSAIEQPLLASNPCAVWSLLRPTGAEVSGWMRASLPAALLDTARP